jgi:hypothetical protein
MLDHHEVNNEAVTITVRTDAGAELARRELATRLAGFEKTHLLTAPQNSANKSIERTDGLMGALE